MIMKEERIVLLRMRCHPPQSPTQNEGGRHRGRRVARRQQTRGGHTAAEGGQGGGRPLSGRRHVVLIVVFIGVRLVATFLFVARSRKIQLKRIRNFDGLTAPPTVFFQPLKYPERVVFDNDEATLKQKLTRIICRKSRHAPQMSKLLPVAEQKLLARNIVSRRESDLETQLSIELELSQKNLTYS